MLVTRQSELAGALTSSRCSRRPSSSVKIRRKEGPGSVTVHKAYAVVIGREGEVARGLDAGITGAGPLKLLAPHATEPVGLAVIFPKVFGAEVPLDSLDETIVVQWCFNNSPRGNHVAEQHRVDLIGPIVIRVIAYGVVISLVERDNHQRTRRDFRLFPRGRRVGQQ